MAPLRVLCIHGYRQNGGSFREKTGALRKLLKKQVELVYLDAPHSVRRAVSEGGSPSAYIYKTEGVSISQVTSAFTL